MKSIKTVLTQRWYAWEDARVAAMEDEEVNLYADPDKGEPAYLRRQHEQRTQSAEDGSEVCDNHLIMYLEEMRLTRSTALEHGGGPIQSWI